MQFFCLHQNNYFPISRVLHCISRQHLTVQHSSLTIQGHPGSNGPKKIFFFWLAFLTLFYKFFFLLKILSYRRNLKESNGALRIYLPILQVGQKSQQKKKIFFWSIRPRVTLLYIYLYNKKKFCKSLCNNVKKIGLGALHLHSINT